jgi:ribosomal protein S18 acetylase RimI-like enzyme
MLKDISLAGGLVLRGAQAEDAAVMEQLFRSTRDYFHAMPIPPQYVDLLLAQQYQVLQASYARQWPRARTLIVELAGAAIGKLMLDEEAATVHIIDFILEPGLRGKGYGTAVLQALQAAAGDRRIGLSVDRQNPAAKRLYLGLGFQVEGASETHESMSWSASPAAAF